MSGGWLCCSVLALAGVVDPAPTGEGTHKGPISVYDFEMKSIDGKSVKLSKYKGEVLMIINVASK